MTRSAVSGHRQRLKEHFMAGEGTSRTDEALLELLLTYALPQKDVQSLVTGLMARFGSLSGVLAADTDTLCRFDGIKTHTATLLKLADWIRTHQLDQPPGEPEAPRQPTPMQAALFEDASEVEEIIEDDMSPEPDHSSQQRPSPPRRGTGLFGKAVLKEAISLLPRLPDTESLDEIREFFRANLHYSAEQTRTRYTDYIVRRMFPNGYADGALRSFARHYEGRQEPRDACFYRFCIAEPVMYDIVNELLIHAMGTGRLSRSLMRNYLTSRFPESGNIKDGAQAIVDALVAGGIVHSDRQKISFAYREVLTPSLAFVLHSEFPEPGMYAIDDMLDNRAVRAMLWNPDRLLPALYELRNHGLVAKVSEIDNFRQFTTRYHLEDVVTKLTQMVSAKASGT